MVVVVVVLGFVWLVVVVLMLRDGCWGVAEVVVAKVVVVLEIMLVSVVAVVGVVVLGAKQVSTL